MYILHSSAQELWHFSARNASGAPSAQELWHFSARNASEAPSAREKIPFSARNTSVAPSVQDLWHFSAREAVGIPFCAGNDTFFCLDCLRGTFRAGFEVFSCSGGGWYPFLRGKRYLFLPGMPPWYLLCRIGGIFLPGRRLVSLSAREKIPFSAWNASVAPSAQEMWHFSAQEAGVFSSAREKIPFSARNASKAPFAQDLWHFSAREAGGIPFCAGKDTFFCPECLRSTFCAGIGAFFCPGGGIGVRITTKKKAPEQVLKPVLVTRQGIEPWTPTLRVSCSTS